MSNLVPKRITDKNGVISTRWVNPDHDTAKRPVLPLPSIYAPVESREEKMERAIAVCLNTISGVNPDDRELYEEQANDAREAFLDFCPMMLDEIIASERVHHHGIGNLLEDGSSAEVIREYVNLPPAAISMVGIYDSTMLIQAMRKYPLGEAPIANKPYPEIRRQKCAALVKITYTLKSLIADGSLPQTVLREEKTGEYTWAKYITDDRMASIALDRYEDADRIVDFIKTRRTNDVDRILEMLDSDTPSIAEGVL